MKSSRMFSVLNLLINNPKITAKELADKLEVSKRTIYRDIEALNMAGVPVVSYPGQGGGLGILEGYTLHKNFLSTDEHQQIITALQALKSVASDNTTNILIEKLFPNSEIFANSDTMIDLSSWYDEHYLQAFIKQIRENIHTTHILEIEYQGYKGLSMRSIEPYKLVFKANDWYLYAYCLKQEDYRLFKLRRIMKLKATEATFKVRPYDQSKILPSLQDATTTNQQPTTPIQIKLRYKTIDEAKLMEIMGVHYFHFNTKEKTIRFETLDTSWVMDFIIRLKDKVEVTSPLTLREDIKTTIANLYHLYF